MTNKKDLSELDICRIYILPALIKAGWNPKTQIREQVYFTDGKIHVRGNITKRGKRKRADYILYYKPNIPIGIIEVKKNTFSIRSGLQQALDYANILDIPNVYSSNGDGFFEHIIGNNKVEEKELNLSSFPSPKELWERYKIFKKIEKEDQERIVSQDYHFDGSDKKTRYYQQNAINRSVEAVAKGNQRVLLTMATGTGKTMVAFQIIYRLMKSLNKKRVLFLADRNAIIDQTKRNDFKHFKKNLLILKNKNFDKSYEVYLSIYQALVSSDGSAKDYKQFSPDFFDLIVVDECHRGSVKDDSLWKEILNYFSSSTQIGLTATPKETKFVSNIEYFGEPIYSYSLKQGIDDGFLAPYKVIKIGLNTDLEGWRPEKGKTDKEGNIVEDRVYNVKDYDKNLVIDERTQSVANKVSEFLHKTNSFDKTIIFCVDIDHAERMRAAIVKANPELCFKNRKYVMQITGDNKEGKYELDNFIDPSETYPVIATTSKLMTTGVDTQTCKVIVLDSNIGSMTEFKQIIGRGTRIREDYNKKFFTIIDFRNVTDLFADPTFDGEPVSIKNFNQDDEITGYENETGEFSNTNGETFEEDDQTNEKPIITGGDITTKSSNKIYVNGVDVSILNERIQYLDENGNLITGNLKDYTKKRVLDNFRSLEIFLNEWNTADKKKVLIDEMTNKGIIFENLKSEINRDLDIFDLVCHVAFDQPPLTRAERVKNVKKRNYFSKYKKEAKEILEALLDKYSNEGIENIEDNKILKLKPFTDYGSPVEILNIFGGPAEYDKIVNELKKEIYRAA